MAQTLSVDIPSTPVDGLPVTTISELRSLHLDALADADRIVAGLRPADLTLPTPCAGWDLRTLLAHMIGQNHGFATAFAGGDAPVEAFAHRPPAAADIASSWTASTARLVAAFAAVDPDARVRLVEIGPDQPFPAPLGITFQLIDAVIHNWDVASTVGVAYRPDAALLASTLEVARKIPGGESRERPGAAFGPILTGSTDDEWAETLALLGRDVAWKA